MIKKFFIFKEALDEKNTNSPKLQKLVDEANSLLTQIYNKHFELVLYNWIDDKTNTLYHERRSPILSDNLMPQMSWERM